MTPELLKQLIGANVRRLRKDSGRTVDELSAKAGCARGYWYEVETGVTNPTVEILSEIARALGVLVRDLLTPEPQTVFAQSEVSREKKPKRRKSA